MSVTAVVVDDEKLARDIILEYLNHFPEIEVTAQCENGEEAIETINRLSPDIVFLDVQMPGCSGFEVLENLDKIPMIIFSTAHSGYALKAFEVSAVDYLLKPYTQERFNKAVLSALSLLKKGYPDMSQRIMKLMETLRQNRPYAQRLFVKLRDRVVPVDVNAIEWLEAQDDYTRIHTTEQSYLAGQTLTHLLSLLDPGAFMRIHRSSVVNIHFIKEIQKTFKGNYSVHMASGARLPVGRTWLKPLKEKMV